MGVQKRTTPGGGSKNQPRSFKCTGYGNCDMSFTRAEHLARHIRKHTGEKPFQCEVCNRFFSRIDNLKQHRESVHSIPTISTTRSKRQSRSKSLQEGAGAVETSFGGVLNTATAVRSASLPTFETQGSASPASPRQAPYIYGAGQPAQATAEPTGPGGHTPRMILPPIFMTTPRAGAAGQPALLRQPLAGTSQQAEMHVARGQQRSYPGYYAGQQPLTPNGSNGSCDRPFNVAWESRIYVAAPLGSATPPALPPPTLHQALSQNPPPYPKVPYGTEYVVDSPPLENTALHSHVIPRNSFMHNPSKIERIAATSPAAADAPGTVPVTVISSKKLAPVLARAQSPPPAGAQRLSTASRDAAPSAAMPAAPAPPAVRAAQDGARVGRISVSSMLS
ncbi:FAFL136Wp [Eremothecium gossypii FDAG1]|nr:FAFL136Wp [Eremothecium gossypii FDAG1]